MSGPSHRGADEEYGQMRNQDCIGSGWCCAKAPCTIGYSLHGSVTPCSSLVFKDDRFWCKELLNETDEEEWKKIATKVGGIGSGCCSNLNSTRPTSPFYNPEYAKKFRLSVLSSLSSLSEPLSETTPIPTSSSSA